MSDSVSSQPKTFRKPMYYVYLIGGVVIAFGLILSPKLAHIRFLLSSNSSGIEPNPIPELEPIAVPVDWPTCKFGAITFRHPPDLKAIVDSSKKSVLKLASDGKSILVDQTTPIRDTASSQFGPELEVLTRLQLEFLAHSTGSRDFRWSMTSTEVRRLDKILSIRRLMENNTPTASWRVSGAKIRGLFTFSLVMGSFELEIPEENVSCGFMFGQKDNSADISWMKMVCTSVRLNSEFK